MDGNTIVAVSLLFVYAIIVGIIFWYRGIPTRRAIYRVKIVTDSDGNNRYFAQVRRKWHYNWMTINYQRTTDISLAEDSKFVLRRDNSILGWHSTFNKAEDMCKLHKKHFSKEQIDKVQYHGVCND